MMIILAGMVALLFNPVYKWMLGKGRSKGTAASVTLLATLLSVVIPLFIVGFITFLQVSSLVNDIANGNYNFDTGSLLNTLIAEINNLLAKAGVDYTLTIEGITSALSAGAEQISKTLLSGILSSITGIFSLITASIIYIYVFMSILFHQDSILSTLKKLNPLGGDISDLYQKRISAMTKATVRGQFIIAFFQGTASAIVLAIAGMSDLFFFFWMLLTVMSIIPLGAGIITIPIGIIMILTGNVAGGVLVIANHLIVVTNIDNILRPQLVPQSARLDPALMILAVFAGMGLFGFIGIVIGPVIMVILATTLQLFLEIIKDTNTVSLKKIEKPQSRIIARVRLWRKSFLSR
jgi:predicted PurR-regulated permease PerM